MTNRQLYDRIYYIVNKNITWQQAYKATDTDKISEIIAIDIMNFLSKYKKTITYIDLGDDND